MIKARNKTTGEIRGCKRFYEIEDFSNGGTYKTLSEKTFLSEWEVIDEPKEDYSHTHCWNNKNNPCGIPLEKHTQCCLCDMKVPSSSLEDKIVEEFNTKFARISEMTRGEFVISDITGSRFETYIDDTGKIIGAGNLSTIANWLKSKLSQLLQEYDNMKGSKFRMGYEAGRREVLDIINKMPNATMSECQNEKVICAEDLIKNLNNK